jgi:hypothetical protein
MYEQRSFQSDCGLQLNCTAVNQIKKITSSGGYGLRRLPFSHLHRLNRERATLLAEYLSKERGSMQLLLIVKFIGMAANKLKSMLNRGVSSTLRFCQMRCRCNKLYDLQLLPHRCHHADNGLSVFGDRAQNVWNRAVCIDLLSAQPSCAVRIRAKLRCFSSDESKLQEAG